MKLSYKKVPSSNNPNDPWIPRPIIRIELFSGKQHQKIDALLDSGADASLFHSSIADLLGIKLTDGLEKEFFGISEKSIKVYFHKIQMQITGFDKPFDALVGFTKSDGVAALLGQADFFENYKITFDRKKEIIEIK